MRKSCGSTSSSRSTCTMFGATSSSRPPRAAAGRSRLAGANVSYWPRTREARNDSSIPSSTPVTLPPTAPSTAPPGTEERRSSIFCSSGLSTARNPATLALIQPARSTTSTGVSCPWRSCSVPGSPSVSGRTMRVNARTCSSEDFACRRNSATIARASSRLTSGPGRTNRVAVATARFQSTISTPPMLVMGSRYVGASAWGSAARCACGGPGRFLGAGSLPDAALFAPAAGGGRCAAPFWRGFPDPRCWFAFGCGVVYACGGRRPLRGAVKVRGRACAAGRSGPPPSVGRVGGGGRGEGGGWLGAAPYGLGPVRCVAGCGAGLAGTGSVGGWVRRRGVGLGFGQVRFRQNVAETAIRAMPPIVAVHGSHPVRSVAGAVVGPVPKYCLV